MFLSSKASFLTGFLCLCPPTCVLMCLFSFSCALFARRVCCDCIWQLDAVCCPPSGPRGSNTWRLGRQRCTYAGLCIVPRKSVPGIFVNNASNMSRDGPFAVPGRHALTETCGSNTWRASRQRRTVACASLYPEKCTWLGYLWAWGTMLEA